MSGTATALVVVLAAGADLQAAVDANPPGTVFELASGVYRGQVVSPKDHQSFIGAASGGTILNGSRLITQCDRLGALWRCDGLPEAKNESRGKASRDHPLALARGDLFIDDLLYSPVAGRHEVKAGSWSFDPAKNCGYVSDDVKGKSVEVSDVANAFLPTAKGVVLRNLTIEKYASNAQSGAIQAGEGWRVEDVTIRWNHGAGINVGPSNVVTRSRVVENGQIGIEGWHADRAEIVGLEIAGNNYAGYDMDWDAGGAKIASSARVKFIGNFVHDNHGIGLWGDIDDTGFLFEGNRVIGNDYYGIMYEISYGAVMRDNDVAGNGQHGPFGTAAQIYVSNSQSVEVVRNRVEVGPDGGNGIQMIYADRGGGSLGPYDARDNVVHDNTIVHHGRGKDGIAIYFNHRVAAGWSNRWNGNHYQVTDPGYPYWRIGAADYTWTQLQRAGFEAQGTLSVIPPH
jgi:hypothetical protein